MLMLCKINCLTLAHKMHFFNYKEKILDKLGNYIKIFEDKNLKINTMTFVQMFLDENLKNADVMRKTDIFNLKPDYLEKSQAERDKK